MSGDAVTHGDALSSQHLKRGFGSNNDTDIQPITHRGSPKKNASPCVTASPSTPAQKLLELAYQVRRLTPSRHDPERFHLEKDEVFRALRSIARDLGGVR